MTFSKVVRKNALFSVSEWIWKKINSTRNLFLASTETVRSILTNSERLWAQTVAARQHIMETCGNVGLSVLAMTGNGRIGILTDNSFPSKDGASLLSVWDLVPASYNCPLEAERIGRMGDGGKWVAE